MSSSKKGRKQGNGGQQQGVSVQSNAESQQSSGSNSNPDTPLAAAQVVSVDSEDERELADRKPGAVPAELQAALQRALASRSGPNSMVQGSRDGGRFAAQKSALQRGLNAMNVNRSLNERSSREELIQQGVLQDPDRRAPSLQGVSRQLEKNLLAHSLQNKLHGRQSSDVLERSNVLRSVDVAPSLRQAKVALQHALTRDQVNQLISNRPDPSSTNIRNIVGSTNIAPGLAGIQRQLERNMLEDRLGQAMESRPDPAELAKYGVRNPETDYTASSLHGVQRQLERNLAKSNLYHALQSRPDVSELAQRGIWQDVDSPSPQQQASSSRQQRNQTQQASFSPQLQAQRGQQQASSAFNDTPYIRTRAFQLTRLLLSFVSRVSSQGLIGQQEKGQWKDTIVRQDERILQAAQEFEHTRDEAQLARAFRAIR